MLFGLVVFLSAFLLFQLQLIVAKHLLPWFGGTPSVWTTSQMFFQVLLLAGYAYAHVLTRRGSNKTQYLIHVTVLGSALVALSALIASDAIPLLAPAWLKPDGTEVPALRLLVTLAISAALPFFALSATAPLLQRWHSRSVASIGRTYRLYALSNAGSFLALLSYPVAVERALDLPQQAWLWTLLFVVFAVGCAAVARRSASYADSAERIDPVSDAPTAERESGLFVRVTTPTVACWLLLSFITSVAFLATTNQLTQDVAAVPFLWVLPLAIYLATFILCFERPSSYSRRWVPVAVALASIAVLPTVLSGMLVPLQVLSYSVFLFAFCFMCHGELVRLRPSASHLTLFYLLLALGGALGGTFVSLAAPALFPDLWEFQGAIVVGWLVIAMVWTIDRTSPFWTGDRWLFAAFLAIVFWMTIRYVFERTAVARLDLIERYGWTLTFAGGAILAAAISAAFWKAEASRWTLWPRALLLFLVAMSGIFFANRVQTTQAGVIHAARNFYGVVSVVRREIPGGESRQLMHGTTTHGVEVSVARSAATPTAYYSPSSGIALAATRLVRQQGSEGGVHFGIVGLGIGTMSGFAREGDRVRYYEINPEVISLAQGSRPYFTYVKTSKAESTIVPGDARLTLERELAVSGSQQFDLLVMDAFSSDSVPLHLVTIEAFRLYAQHLRNDRSILAVNVTNRYLDLEPVVASHAAELGLAGVRINSEGDPPVRMLSSWILLARNRGVFNDYAVRFGSARPLGERHVRFTDGYSNLLRILK
jgi:hypothetical protein